MKKLFIILTLMILPLSANARSPIVTGNWINHAIKLCKPHGGIDNIIFIDNLIFNSDVVLTCVNGKQFKS